MEIKLNISKHYSELSKCNYLACDIEVNGKWLKEIVMDSTDDLNDLLKVIPDSIKREELKYKEYKRNDHDADCDCQFNPNYHVESRLASESCPVHNYNPIDLEDQLK